MNKFIRNNFFHHIIYLLFGIIFVCIHISLRNPSNFFPYFGKVFFLSGIYCFFHFIIMCKSFKIENGYLLVKQFFYIKKFDLKDLTDFYEKKQKKDTQYIFYFNKTKITIYSDKKTQLLIDYFFTNHFEDFYKKKYTQYELKQKEKPKKNIYLFLIYHIFYGVSLFLYAQKSILYGLNLGGKDLINIFFLTIIFIQVYIIEFSRLKNSYKFFDGEGLHLKKYVISYDEIKKVIEFEKKIASLRFPIYIKSLRIITEVEEIIMDDNLSSNVALYRYTREKIKQKEIIVVERKDEYLF